MANKTYEMRKEITRLLKTLTANVYYDQAPDDATNPYLVYELMELNHDEGKTLLELEINALDYGTNTTPIENLCDEIQYLLHRLSYINAFIQFRVYRGLRQKVEEEDKQIIRRRLTFEVHLHQLKGE